MQTSVPSIVLRSKYNWDDLQQTHMHDEKRSLEKNMSNQYTSSGPPKMNIFYTGDCMTSKKLN